MAKKARRFVGSYAAVTVEMLAPDKERLRAAATSAGFRSLADWCRGALADAADEELGEDYEETAPD